MPGVVDELEDVLVGEAVGGRALTAGERQLSRERQLGARLPSSRHTANTGAAATNLATISNFAG